MYNIKKSSFLFFNLLIGSIIIFILAPNYYHSLFNLGCFLYNIISIIFFLYIKKKKNYFDFDILFILTFQFVYYIYPIVIYPVNPEYFFMFTFKFNHDVISQGTSLATVGISSYLFGSIINEPVEKPCNKEKFIYVQNNVTILATILLSFVFLSQFNQSVFTKNYSEFDKGNLLEYFFLLFSAFLITAIAIEFNNIKNKNIGTVRELIVSFDKKLLSVTILFVLFYLYIGSRTFPLQIIIVVVSLFSIFIKSIRWKNFLALSIGGIFFMSFLSVFRMIKSTGNDLNFKFNFLDAGMDLIINNRNLYVAIDFVKKNGISYGKTMLGNVLAPIPFLQSMMNTLVGIDPHSTTSSQFFTNLELGRNAELGLGTNIIADLYLAFGFGGVIIFMIFLGYYANKALNKAKEGNFYSLIIYSVLVSYSVYIVRAEYFFFLRLLIWSLFIAVFVKSFNYTLTQLKNHSLK